MAKPLSPAAQSVLDAANGASSYGPDDCLNDAPRIAAAALQALADQVVPGESPPSGGMRPGGTGMLTLDEAQGFQRATTRRRILAIAAELEGRGDA